MEAAKGLFCRLRVPNVVGYPRHVKCRNPKMTVLANCMAVTMPGNPVFLPIGFPSKALGWWGQLSPVRILSPASSGSHQNPVATGRFYGGRVIPTGVRRLATATPDEYR
jgi:hypothetical protein